MTRRTCRQGGTARLIRARDVDAVLPLGDTQYDDGRFTDFQASYAHSWGTFRGKSLPVVGNHEYRRPDAQGFFRYFRNQVPNRHGWYAVNRGRWRIYLLNSNCSEVSCRTERIWLRRDLVRHPHRCSLAAMHHPRFSSGSEHGNSLEAAKLWPTLDRHQVDVVLAGHDHDYERFAPMHSSGTVAAGGIRSFVSGLGGKSLYPFGKARHGSRARVGGRFGVLFMTLADGRYSWRFVSLKHRVLDSGSARCVR